MTWAMVQRLPRNLMKCANAFYRSTYPRSRRRNGRITGGPSQNLWRELPYEPDEVYSLLGFCR